MQLNHTKMANELKAIDRNNMQDNRNLEIFNLSLNMYAACSIVEPES